MSKQVKILSDEALSLICSLLKNAQTTGDVISDTVASNTTYSSLKIEEILEDYAKHEDVQVLTSDDIEAMLGLSSEELESLANLISDTTIELNKTWSSSYIYGKLNETLESSKAYTLQELSKAVGASYKVVTSVDQMTDSKVLYLLKDTDSGMYNIYVYDEDAASAELIGSFEINLDDYYTKTESENIFATKVDVTANYATKTELQSAIEDVEIEVSTDENNQIETRENGLYVGKPYIEITQTEYDALSDDEKNNGIPYYITDANLRTGAEVVIELNNTVTDEQVPSAKVVYENINNLNDSLANGRVRFQVTSDGKLQYSVYTE